MAAEDLLTIKLKVKTEGEAEKLERLEKTVERLRSEVKKLKGTPFEIPTGPADAALQKLIKQVKRLERELDNAEKAFDEAVIENKFAKTEASAKKLTNATKNLAVKSQALVDVSKKLPPVLRKGADGMDKLKNQTGKAAASLRRYENRVKKAGKATVTFRGSISALRGSIVAVIAAMVVRQIFRFGKALLGIAQDAVEVKKKFDTLIPSLRSFTGSTQLAEEVVDRLAATADRLKIPLADIVDPFVKLAATGSQVGLTIGEVGDVFDAVAISAKAFGLSAADINLAMNAISQVAGKGVACVDTDTEILTAAGWSSVEHLRIGDSVAQFDEGLIVFGELQKIHCFNIDETGVVMISGGERVRMTCNHRVITAGGEVRAADSLARADIPVIDERKETVDAPASFAIEHLSCEVWCPQTPLGTWIARKGSLVFATGNSMEEFRRQLAERIPNAIPAVAIGLGVTIPEAIAKISSGSLEAGVALKALTVGLNQLNKEAGEAQLGTLGSEMGAFERATEKANSALADGFGPGLKDLVITLTEVVNENREVIASLGGVLGASLETAAGMIKAADDLTTFEDSTSSTAKAVRFLAGALGELADLNNIFALPNQEVAEFEDSFVEVGNAITGVSKQVQKEFDDIAKAALDSAEDSEIAFKKSFREQAEAAGISTDTIKEAEKTLSAELGAIFEATTDRRKEAEERFLSVKKDVDSEVVDIAKVTSFQLKALNDEIVDSTADRLNDLVAEWLTADAAIVAAAAVAAEEIQGFISGVTEAAIKSAGVRVDTSKNTSKKIQDIEERRAKAIVKIEEELAEKLAGANAEERIRLAADTAEAIVKIEEDAADAIVAELAKIAEASKRSTDKRIADAKRLQAEHDTTLEKLQDIAKELDDIGSSETGFGGQADQVGRLIDAVDDLEGRLNAFGEVEESLAQKLAKVNAVLDPLRENFFAQSDASDQVADAFEEGADQGQVLLDTIEKLANASQGLDADSRQLAATVLQSYGSIADSVRDPIRAAQDLTDAFKRLFPEITDPSLAADNAIKRLRDSLTETATAATSAGDTQVESAERSKVAYDELTKTFTNAKDSTEEVGDAAEEAGQQAEEAADGIEKQTEALDKNAEASAKASEATKSAAEGAKELGGASKEAADGLGAVAKAADDIPADIFTDDQTESLRRFREEAELLTPVLLPIPAPLGAIDTSVRSISESLPSIAEKLPEVGTAITTILELLKGNPIDFEALATNVTALSVSIETIAKHLSTLRSEIESLPADLKATTESLDLLAKLAAAMAEGDQIAIIARQFAELAVALPGIPEPIERIEKALGGIVEKKDEVVESLTAARVALVDLASEETTERITTLSEAIEKLQEGTSKLGAGATKVRDEFEQITLILPDMTKKMNDYVSATGSASEAHRALKASSVEAVQGLNDVGEAIDQNAEKMREWERQVVATFDVLDQRADAYIEKLREILRLLKEIASATGAVPGL